MRPSLWLIAWFFVLGLATLPASADDAAPGRIGRISVAETGVGLRPSGGDWSQAVANEPVAAGTSLRTGPERAEIRLPGVVIAVAPATLVDIVRLDDTAARIALKQGRIGLSLDRTRKPPPVEIDTVHGVLTPGAAGRYDIDADVGVLTNAAADEFGAWWRSRIGDTAPSDRVPADRVPADRVPATMPGAAALAANGDWADSPKDGPVWYPKNLAADWAPYRDGSWRFLPPWGWTWIDDAPWGFAPSHYGRWARIDEHWGWLPGAGDAATSYRPAVVAFLGTAGIGLSYAGGSGPAVAWFPLGPGETYWPGEKGAAPADIVNATYRNRRFTSAVPRPVFVGGKPVAAALVDIPVRRLDVVPAIPGSPQISPPAPRLVASIRPVGVIDAAIAPPQTVSPHKAAPLRIALDTPRRKHGKVRAAPHRRPHTPPPPIHLAIAPSHPGHPHRHLAEARHILRQ